MNRHAMLIKIKLELQSDLYPLEGMILLCMIIHELQPWLARATDLSNKFAQVLQV
jgi:hypothetical protein